jgi:N-methylhydantoinase B
MRTATDYGVGAADLEVAWTRLLSVVDEAAATLVRTAYSVTIREMKDLAVVLFDPDGNSLAEAAIASPSFIGTLPRTMAAFLAWRSAERWQPGDLVITNDPWLGTGHLQDISMVAPIFGQGAVVAFVAVAAHGPDIGGSIYSAISREIFEEGLRIPICEYARAGERNDLVRAFIRGNVRVPDKVIGDLEAMAASCAMAGRRVQRLLDEIGPGTFVAVTRELLARSERAMREAIRRTPDGRYEAHLAMDGFDERLEIRIAVTVRGDSVLVDYEGSSQEQPLGINVPFTYTYAHTAYPLKCLFQPRLPNNAGTFRPISVRAPEGSILNPRHPAPVSARHITGHFLSGAVLRALARALPDRVIAESGAPPVQLVVSGEDGGGRQFTEQVVLAGGLGARPNKDGLSVISYPTNVSWIPTEMIEALTPLRVERKEIRARSGGGGRFRGGDGQRFVVTNSGREPLRLSVLADLTHRGPLGVAGGRPGRETKIRLGGRPLGCKVVTDFMPESRLLVETSGGGGYGPPQRPARINRPRTERKARTR